MPLLLTHKELINPSLGFMPLHTPRYIPIHPDVYESPFAFTAGHADAVLKALPEYIQEDALALGRKLPSLSFEKERLDDILTEPSLMRATANEGTAVGFGFGSVNIAMGKRTDSQDYMTEIVGGGLSGGYRSTLSREKIRAYDFFRGAHAANGTYQLRTWYAHNIHDGGPEVLLLMRNFAIAFNNEGMKRLGMQ